MRRNKQGKIVFTKGFFIKYLWGANSWRILNRHKIAPLMIQEEKEKWKNPEYPKNICSLFWGSVFSPFVCLISLFCFALAWIVFAVVIVFAACLMIVAGLITSFFGHFPVLCKNYYLKNKNDLMTFHPYKRYGKNDEKRMKIVPWQIVLPTLFIWWMIATSFSVPRTIATGTYSAIASSIFWFVVMVIAAFIGAIVFFRSKTWETVWEVIVEFLKAKKQKMCPLITFEEKQKQ